MYSGDRISLFPIYEDMGYVCRWWTWNMSFVHWGIKFGRNLFFRLSFRKRFVKNLVFTFLLIVWFLWPSLNSLFWIMSLIWWVSSYLNLNTFCSLKTKKKPLALSQAVYVLTSTVSDYFLTPNFFFQCECNYGCGHLISLFKLVHIGASLLEELMFLSFSSWQWVSGTRRTNPVYIC